MNGSISMYKVLTFVLLAIAIILGVLLYQEKNMTFTESLTAPTDTLAECNAAIAGWKATNGTVIAQASAEAQAELTVILEDCSETLN